MARPIEWLGPHTKPTRMRPAVRWHDRDKAILAVRSKRVWAAIWTWRSDRGSRTDCGRSSRPGLRTRYLHFAQPAHHRGPQPCAVGHGPSDRRPHWASDAFARISTRIRIGRNFRTWNATSAIMICADSWRIQRGYGYESPAAAGESRAVLKCCANAYGCCGPRRRLNAPLGCAQSRVSSPMARGSRDGRAVERTADAGSPVSLTQDLMRCDGSRASPRYSRGLPTAA